MVNPDSKMRLLIVSSVLPFPRHAGQQQRVYYKIKALQKNFHITFLTVANQADALEVRCKLLDLCDDVIVLPSRYTSQSTRRFFFRAVGVVYELITGLKFSNYLMSGVEFPASRLQAALGDRTFDGVLFEYWHAHKATRLFQKTRAQTILDMHDILWRSYVRQLDANSHIPHWLKDWRVHRYQVREESAWNDFDILIAINQDELDYVCQRVSNVIQLIYAPMGTDLSLWHYIWQPVTLPRRIAFYGGLANPQNQRDALLCYQEIMPMIWKRFPEVEFWVVGSNPPDSIRDLERDSRVHVTGFLESPQEVLKTTSFILCPWSGMFGFRSRIVEVMSLGVPVLASREAVHGMGFEIGNGILVSTSSTEMAAQGLEWLENDNELAHQSSLARRQIENKFSYEATYVKLADELAAILGKSRAA